MKLWIGVLVFIVMAVWMTAEFFRVRRVVLHRYERGFAYDDRKVKYEIEWTDVATVEAQYVPGITNAGAKNPSNLVGLVVSFPRGTISVHKELSDFSPLVEAFRKHAPVWRDTTVANLMHRS